MSNKETTATETNPYDSVLLDLSNKLASTLPTYFPPSAKIYFSVLTLNLSENNLTSLPKSLFISFPNLVTLDLRYNRLMSIHQDISKLQNLKVLRLCYNSLASIPFSLGELCKLEILSVSHNNLSSLPSSIGCLANLTNFCISENSIKILPEELCNLSSLKILNIYHNRIVAIPSGFWKLDSLEEFCLEWFNYVTPRLPAFIKGVEGSVVISSLKMLCKCLYEANAREVSLIAFMAHFSENEDFMSVAHIKDALHTAAGSNDLGVLEGIVLYEPKVMNLVNSEGCSALCIALAKSHITAAKMLIDKGAAIDKGAGEYGSLLHLAVNTLDPELVQVFVKKGAEVNKVDKKGNTPFHSLFLSFSAKPAVREAIARILLSKGARPNAKNCEKWAVVHIAARQDRSEPLETILKLNEKLQKIGKETFDLNMQGGDERWTPLHIAAFSGCFETVKLLLDNGANVFAKCSKGKLPRFYARSHVAVYKLLFRAEKVEAQKFIEDVEKLNFMPNGQEKQKPCMFGPKRYISSISFFVTPHKKSKYLNSSAKTEKGSADTSSSPSKNFSYFSLRKTRAVPFENTLTTPRRIPEFADTVLNNNKKPSEKYCAMTNLLRKSARSINALKAIENTLNELERINSVSVQVDLVKLASHFPNLRLLHILVNKYKAKIRNRALKYEVSSAVQIISTEFEWKREKSKRLKK